MTYFHQQNGFIKVSGADAFSLLQGLISQDLRGLHEHNRPVYSLWLNNKGQYKFDFFIWPFEDKSYLIEVALAQIDALQKHLKFYKLRAEVKIETYGDVISVSSLRALDDDYKPDPRIDGLFRALKSSDTPIQNSFDYHLWRLQNGLPHYTDLKSDEDTPIEVGFDELGAISYNKGCYLGQEGTNKAKHKLIIKKRLFPFELKAERLSTDVIFNGQEKIAGHIRHFEQGWGLALIKLKFMDEDLYIEGQKIKIHKPFWHNKD